MNVCLFQINIFNDIYFYHDSGGRHCIYAIITWRLFFSLAVSYAQGTNETLKYF